MSRHRMTYEQIIAYAAGELSQADTSHVESWLQDSPELAETVSRFREARAAIQADDSIAPPAELIAQAKALFVASKPQRSESLLDVAARTIAALVFDSRATPALAGLRGVAEAYQLSYQTDAGNIDLEISPCDEPDGDRCWRVMGQFDSPSRPANVRVAVAAADGGNTSIIEVSADAHGVFEFALKVGTYDLILGDSETVTIVRGVPVG